jgi:hypothetical protein
MRLTYDVVNQLDNNYYSGQHGRSYDGAAHPDDVALFGEYVGALEHVLGARPGIARNTSFAYETGKVAEYLGMIGTRCNSPAHSEAAAAVRSLRSGAGIS